MTGRRNNRYYRKAGRPSFNWDNALKNHIEKEREKMFTQKVNYVAERYGIPQSASQEEKVRQIRERMEAAAKLEAEEAALMIKLEEQNQWFLANFAKLPPDHQKKMLKNPAFAHIAERLALQSCGFLQQPQQSLPQDDVSQQMPCSLGLQQFSQSPALENDQQAVMFEWSVEEQQQEPSLGEQQPTISGDNQPLDIQKQQNFDTAELDKLLQPSQPQEASLPESSQPSENQAAAPQSEQNLDSDEFDKLLQPRQPQEASRPGSSQTSESEAAAPQNKLASNSKRPRKRQCPHSASSHGQ